MTPPVPSLTPSDLRLWVIGCRSERRPYMRAAYSLFKGDGTESDLAKQMDVASGNRTGGDVGGTSGAPYFYANLYLGLYAEAKGDAVLARKCERAFGNY